MFQLQQMSNQLQQFTPLLSYLQLHMGETKITNLLAKIHEFS